MYHARMRVADHTLMHLGATRRARNDADAHTMLRMVVLICLLLLAVFAGIALVAAEAVP
jgi:hypothetical protein